MLRISVVLLSAAGLLWLVVASGFGISLALSAPQLALKAQPWNARALANQAYRLLSEPGDASDDQAKALALAAFRRDPTVIAALASLGTLADKHGDLGRAENIFSHSHKLSRRDPTTQLWLIELNVARDDVPGALDHFDAGIGASEVGMQLMMPVLASALDDNRLIRPIADMLRRDRWWKQAFLGFAAERSENSPNVARLFVLLSRDKEPPRPDIAQNLVNRLIGEQEFRAARSIDAAMVRRSQSTLRNGGFGNPSGLAPFEWEILEPGTISAGRAVPDDRPNNMALSFSSSDGQRSVIARQLLFLAPGKYRLSAEARFTEADGPWRLSWQLRCASDTAGLAEVDWPSTDGEWRERSAPLKVPATDCPVQWLEFVIRGGVGTVIDASGWTDNVRIEPIAGRPGGKA